ncbi:MAG TPA: PAC2 family protein [Streptosporangiaceae bacterium]|nr:PAC2 family protein [Streptosporangiaceae bacterium]
MPRDPGDLFQLTQQAKDLESDLVMLYYLDGFIDAGAAGRQLAAHLLTTFEHTEVARFDVDSLIDYRSRRPAMFFVKDHWESVEVPEIVVHLLKDAAGTPFLLLDGLEPDREWETFTRAVLRLSATLKVRLVASFHGIPMGVPHTRPLGITGHATSPGLIDGYQPLVDRLQVPGSAMALIELRMGEASKPAVGFAVHVPHYLAHASYPTAAVALLAAVERATGLSLPAEALREAAEVTDAEIARQVAGSDEVTEVVKSLEAQYDAFIAGNQDLLAEAPENMPTADELGAQFEKFLAEQQFGPGTDPTDS